jgi:pyruvate dehydrogenase E2 component (dihydrolipoyllysine-residue acetyltransferase)
MPQMGADMTEGTLIKWLKQEGEEVKRGEIIAEIETDKANVEIEAFASGLLQDVRAHEGDVVKVGEIMAVIAPAGEKIAARGNGAVAVETAEPKSAPATSPQESSTAVTSVGDESQPQETPGPRSAERVSAARPERRERDAATERGSEAAGRIKASPVARRIASENDVDIGQLDGSGPEGRIVRRDVEAAIGVRRLPETGPRPLVAPEPQERQARPDGQLPAGRIVEPTRMRDAIARRMSQSKQQAPHFYVTVTVDMTALMAQRRALNETLTEETRVSVNDLIVKASAVALRRFPSFNGHYGDGRLTLLDRVNICIGVALPDGLIAPSISDCDLKSLLEIASASKDVVARAREGRLRAEEFDGSFTITNLGSYGVDTLIGIINPPQVAILGVGMVQAQPVAKDGAVAVGQVMNLALSADHRAVDGANGGEFLAFLKRVLENPLLLA